MAFDWSDITFDGISGDEIKKYIESEKNPENELDYDKIEKIIFEELDLNLAWKRRCTILDEKRDIKYILNVHRTEIHNRFSIALINQNLGNVLLRFDFGDHIHRNNCGTNREYKVFGSHIHVWAPSSKHANKNVIPITELEDFKNIYNIALAFDKFVQTTNIIKEGEYNDEG